MPRRRRSSARRAGQRIEACPRELQRGCPRTADRSTQDPRRASDRGRAPLRQPAPATRAAPCSVPCRRPRAPATSPASGWPSSAAKPSVAASLGASEQEVAERRHEHARAAGLAPYPTIDGIGLPAVVVAGVELPIIDPELAVEQKQL